MEVVCRPSGGAKRPGEEKQKRRKPRRFPRTEIDARRHSELQDFEQQEH